MKKKKREVEKSYFKTEKGKVMFSRKMRINLGEGQGQYGTLSCKVCRDAGKGMGSVGHGPKSEVDEGLVGLVKEQGWKLNREIVCTTTCPTLMATLCPNPNCFNGADGIIRFPNLGHSMSYCPCEWPSEMSGEKEHERYTMYINECQPCNEVPPPPPPLPIPHLPQAEIPGAPDILLLDTEYELYDEDINAMKAADENVYQREYIYDDDFLNNLGKGVDEELDEIFNYEFNAEEWEKQLMEDEANSVVDPEEALDEIVNYEFNKAEWEQQLKEDEIQRNLPELTLEEEQDNWDNLYGWYHNENERNYLQRMGHQFRKIPARCRHFARDGCCNMKETCKFLHIPERPDTFEKVSQNVEVEEQVEEQVEAKLKILKKKNIYLVLA